MQVTGLLTLDLALRRVFLTQHATTWHASEPESVPLSLHRAPRHSGETLFGPHTIPFSLELPEYIDDGHQTCLPTSFSKHGAICGRLTHLGPGLAGGSFCGSLVGTFLSEPWSYVIYPESSSPSPTVPSSAKSPSRSLVDWYTRAETAMYPDQMFSFAETTGTMVESEAVSVTP
jgi:hypothetical protein